MVKNRLILKNLNKRKQIKRQNITQLLITLFTVLLINYIASFYFFRLDLTSEKRYTLTNHTKELLTNIDDVIYIQIYLEGELPSGFIRLKNSVKEMLDEFRVYAGDNIQYEFINPSESSDKKTRNEIYSQLYKKGIMPTNLKEKDEEGKMSEKIIFPGAIVTFHSKEAPINLLKNNLSLPAEKNLNNSIQELEYSFIGAIHQLSKKIKQQIAIIEGHGEWSDIQMADITDALFEFYNLKRVTIKGQISALDDYQAIIIAGPDSAFDEKDKFIIDQFIMKGGKSFWLYDAVKTNMDSLAYSSTTLALINSINIEDMLFNYGARVNPNIIMDLQCSMIPINTAIVGTPPKFTPAPWYYFPLINPSDEHVITKNLNLIKTEFVSTVDSVGEDPDIKKTFLLYSSKYSKAVNAPARISLDILKTEPDPSIFNKPHLPTAILLEGKFTSLFKNRVPAQIASSKEIGFKEKSNPTKMLIIADADIIRNAVKYEGNQPVPFPLGYDRYTGQTYGNKEFLLNAFNYILDDSGLLSIRSREVTLRLLDRAKIIDNRVFWQTLNLILPIIFVLIFGIILNYLRKRKFAR